MSVQVWSDGQPLVAATVICRAADAEALRIAIAAHGGQVSAFLLAPNGESYLELLRCFLALRNDKNWVPSSSFGISSEAAWIVRNLQRLAFGLTNWDDKAALGAAAYLLQHESALHPQQARFVRFCEGLVTKVVRRLLWGSPLLLSWPPPSAARRWWELSPDLVHDVSAQIADLKSTFYGNVPPAVQGLGIWLSQCHARLSSRLFTASRADAMLEASALCAAIAAIHYSGARHSLTTLFCHRAADFLFTSICADQNLIDYTAARGEGELKTPVIVNGEKKLSLMNCHDALEQGSVLLINSARRSVLSDLNLTRNRLLLTHSMGSPSAADTKNGLQAVISLLTAHGGADWRTAYECYRRGFSVETTALFELSDGLMQMLQPM